jgi:hypothetical protein
MIEATRKTAVPQKIDDFGTNSQGQLAAQEGRRGGTARSDVKRAIL